MRSERFVIERLLVGIFNKNARILAKGCSVEERETLINEQKQVIYILRRMRQAHFASEPQTVVITDAPAN